MFRVARGYDAGLIEMAQRPLPSETRQSLKKVRGIAIKLTLAIADCNHYARTEVAFALSKVRKERKLSNGDDVLPYGHGCSNEWMFDRESLAAFVETLTSLDHHLSAITEQLKSGGRPRGPERTAIEDLKDLWKERYRKDPYEQSLRAFAEFCELVLTPIAARHGRSPSIAASVKNLLYGLEPKPGPWNV